MPRMKRLSGSEARRLVAQVLCGGFGLAALTFVCFRSGLNLATTGFVYLIVVALVSLIGSFIGSIVLSVAGVGLLNYFFTEPLFSFRVEYPQDILTLTAFLTTSVIVTNLAAKVRKEAGEAKASQKALADTIPALVWSALPDGVRNFHSQRWLDFTGLSAEEARSKGWAAAVHPEDLASLREKWRAAVATGEPFEAEARGRSATGDYRWFLVRAEPLRDENGTIVRWYGSNTDIEDRKRVTETLRQSEAKWREIFEHNPVMYFIVDDTGAVLSVNSLGAAQLGYSLSELVGQSVLKVFFEEDREFVRSNVAVCLAKLGCPHSWEVRKVRKDGTVLWVRENAKAIRQADDRLIVLIACENITEAKRANDAMRLSEAYMAHAQQLASIGSWAYSKSAEGSYFNNFGKCEHWSAEMWRIADFDPAEGYPSQELLSSRVHPDDRQQLIEANREVIEASRPLNVQYRYFTADGQLRVLHSIATLVGENEGARLAGATRDVTEQEKQTEDLKRSEAYLAEAQRLSHTGSFGWSVTTGEIVWSEETFRIFEYDRALKPTLDLVLRRIHPEDHDHARQLIQRVSDDVKDWELESRLLLPDGAVKFVRAVAHASTDGFGKPEYVGAVMDVTAVRQAEQALRESEQRFRDYAETASDWYWETGPDHKFTRVTEYERLLGRGLGPVSRIGLAQWDYATDVESEPGKWELHRSMLDARHPFRDFVYETARGNGSLMYVKTNGKPYFDAEGAFLGYRGTGADVTAAIRADQAEAALRKVQAELAHVARVTTLGELTASIAHEITQPVASARNNARAALNFLDQRPPDLGEVREALGCVVGDADRAGVIVDRIRDHIKKAPPRKHRFDLNEAIKEVIGLARSAIAKNGVSVQSCLMEGLFPVQGDRVQLQQVILNLILNAAEAMSAVDEGARELLISTEQRRTNGVLVAVRDSGPGIDPERRERVFEAFYTTKSSGLGMGLSICRSIIDAHGGRLWAEANEPRGAVFQFTLPSPERSSFCSNVRPQETPR